MQNIVTTLKDICLLRANPQDLPYAPRLLVGLVIANAAVSALVGHRAGIAPVALTASLAGAVVVLGFVYLLLKVRALEARFVQAASAIMGAAVAFSVLATPAQLVLSPGPIDPAQLTSNQMLAVVYAAVISIWSLAVSAHIFRHALERSFGRGLVLALLMNFSVVLATQWVLQVTHAP